MNNLSELELKLIEFYKTYYKKHRQSPSVAEAAEYFKVTHQTMSERANNLVNKGYFKKIRRGTFIHTRKKY